MLMEVQIGNWEYEYREHVKDANGNWICPGMYVLADGRQGWVTEAVDEDEDGEGEIKVQICYENRRYKEKIEDLYITNFEPARNWHRALVDG